ncbi:MAG: DMT family transporter [Alphaproteobacteria bacterium]|nr:DMT family transporter [Alphaproteobacteria bacterium]
MPEQPSSRILSDNMIGIAFMLMAVLAGLVTASAVKYLSADQTVLGVLSIRFVFSMPFLIMFGVMIRGKGMWQVNRWNLLSIRVVFGHLGIIFWFLAVSTTTLGQATALFQSSAIFVTILAPFLLKEKVGIWRGGAVLIGLIGICMITNPFSGTINIGSFWGLMSAIAGAVLVIALRKLGKSDEPITVALWHNGIGAVMYPVLVIIWLPIDTIDLMFSQHLLFYIVFGISASLVQLGFGSAYRYGEATVLVPTRYLSVPASALIGWIFWQEQPYILEMVGMVIVIASCIFISIREYRLGWASRATEPFLHKG